MPFCFGFRSASMHQRTSCRHPGSRVRFFKSLDAFWSVGIPMHQRASCRHPGSRVHFFKSLDAFWLVGIPMQSGISDSSYVGLFGSLCPLTNSGVLTCFPDSRPLCPCRGRYTAYSGATTRPSWTDSLILLEYQRLVSWKDRQAPILKYLLMELAPPPLCLMHSRLPHTAITFPPFRWVSHWQYLDRACLSFLTPARSSFSWRGFVQTYR